MDVIAVMMLWMRNLILRATTKTPVQKDILKNTVENKMGFSKLFT